MAAAVIALAGLREGELWGDRDHRVQLACAVEPIQERQGQLDCGDFLPRDGIVDQRADVGVRHPAETISSARMTALPAAAVPAVPPRSPVNAGPVLEPLGDCPVDPGPGAKRRLVAVSAAEPVQHHAR